MIDVQKCKLHHYLAKSVQINVRNDICQKSNIQKVRAQKAKIGKFSFSPKALQILLLRDLSLEIWFLGRPRIVFEIRVLP